MTDLSVTYSVVIPVYNSTESLSILAQRLIDVFAAQGTARYEIILVDDASPDKEVWKVIEGLVKQHGQIRAIQLMRNFGKNGALLCGLHEARGEYIITIDDDLQHLPEDIPQLIRERAHDIVIGAFPSLKTSAFKKSTSKVNAWFEARLIGKPAHIRSSPFRMFRREVVRAMLQIKTPYPSIPALMYYVTRDVVNVQVNHAPRAFGKTGFTLKKMCSTLSNMVINNSSFLLQLIALAGILISGVSFCAGVFYIIKKLTIGTKTPGWASLMVTILFIGGLILFSLGVVGEYLIRIINGVEQKPSYITRKKIGNDI